jgi:Regulator of ribonuclease activity B
MMVRGARQVSANPLGGGMIEIEDLEKLFEIVRSNKCCDLSQPCLWSYFFTDSNRARLLAVAPELESLGYAVVALLEPTPEDDDQETLFLRFDRVERHTVDSLHQRNCELYAFAEIHGFASYDGMEVGPAEPAA